jgi:aminoglycoside phosphotransferase (APT) family kinase protein
MRPGTPTSPDSLVGAVRRALDDPAVEVRAWRQGTDFRADLAVRDGRVLGVVRSPRIEVADTDYDGVIDYGAVLAKEVRVGRLLRRYGVPTPATLASGERADGLPSWVMCEYVADETAESLTPALQTELGRICARIHAIPIEEVRAILPQEPWHHVFLDRMAHRVAGLSRFSAIGDPARLLARIRQIAAGHRPTRLSLLHLDLRPENVCVRGDGIAALLDLANAIVGDPLFELGRLRAIGHLDDRFLAGYREVAPVPGDLTGPVTLVYELETTALLTAVAKEETMDAALFDRMRARSEEIVARLEA